MTSSGSDGADSVHIDFDAMVAMARQNAGVDIELPHDYLARGRQWIDGAMLEGRLSAAGSAGLQQLVTGWLVNRLRFERDLRSHPEILDERIVEPVFVTGMPRTGTTKLQRMLACDPSVSGLPFWRILNLAPMAAVTDPDPRIAAAQGYLELLKNHHHDFLAAHPAFVDEPEEESFLIESDFRSLANCTRVRMPSYWQRIKDDPQRESYPFLKQALQYIQWQRGPGQPRRWILKSPLHVGRLDALFAKFPDAWLVHTHRDPLAALPSNCRIVEVFRRLASDDIDLAELGCEQLAVWSRLLADNLQQRASVGEARIIDVHYDDINLSVMSVVHEIYARRGLSLTAQADRRMHGWERAHPQHQFGQHQYSLSRYGLDREPLAAAFAAYTARFIKPYEDMPGKGRTP